MSIPYLKAKTMFGYYILSQFYWSFISLFKLKRNAKQMWAVVSHQTDFVQTHKTARLIFMI